MECSVSYYFRPLIDVVYNLNIKPYNILLEGTHKIFMSIMFLSISSNAIMRPHVVDHVAYDYLTVIVIF